MAETRTAWGSENCKEKSAPSWSVYMLQSSYISAAFMAASCFVLKDADREVYWKMSRVRS